MGQCPPPVAQKSPSQRGGHAADDAARRDPQAHAQGVNQASVAQAAYSGLADVLAVMRACPDLILAMEALQDASKSGDVAIRQALAVAMAESGATTVLSAGHATSLRDCARVVRVTDESLIPAEFMRQPAPAPDKMAIARELKAGRLIAGAELSNGGAATIQIRSRT